MIPIRQYGPIGTGVPAPPMQAPEELWLVIGSPKQHGIYRATALQNLVRLLSGLGPEVRFQYVERIEQLLDDSGWAFPPALVADPLPLAFVDALWSLDPPQRTEFVRRVFASKDSSERRGLVWQILPERFRNEAGFP